MQVAQNVPTTIFRTKNKIKTLNIYFFKKDQFSFFLFVSFFASIAELKRVLLGVETERLKTLTALIEATFFEGSYW